MPATLLNRRQNAAVLHAQGQARLKPLADTIETGAIFIAEKPVSKSSSFGSEPYSGGWGLVKSLDGRRLAREICGMGELLLFRDDEIKASVFGFRREKTLCRAVKRLLGSLSLEQFNCLEVGEVTTKRFLGVLCTTVFARRRRIPADVVLLLAKGPAAESAAA